MALFECGIKTHIWRYKTRKDWQNNTKVVSWTAEQNKKMHLLISKCQQDLAQLDYFCIGELKEQKRKLQVVKFDTGSGYWKAKQSEFFLV